MRVANSMETIDFGSDVTGYWLGWKPDRSINPQYDDVPDIEKCSLILEHKTPSGEPHQGCVTVDTPETQRIFPNPHHRWQVQSWDPLTITPSVLCSCGWHGFITNGRWVGV